MQKIVALLVVTAFCFFPQFAAASQPVVTPPDTGGSYRPGVDQPPLMDSDRHRVPEPTRPPLSSYDEEELWGNIPDLPGSRYGSTYGALPGTPQTCLSDPYDSWGNIPDLIGKLRECHFR